MSFRVQETIHKWEVGVGQRLVKITAAVLAFVALAVWHDARVFKGLSTAEGLDAAQLARNIARGEGFKTRFIRPFSMFLLNRAETPEGAAVAAPTSRSAVPHPDLANAPVYPGILAGVLKVMPFDYPDLLTARTFTVYSPDLWIAGFNQLLFLLVLVLCYWTGRALFDEPVAWVAVLLVAGTELYWQFTGAGDSTVLVMALVLGFILAAAKIDFKLREEASAEGSAASESKTVLWLAILAGLLLGVMALTRYSLILLVIPAVAWFATLPSPRRTTLAATVALVFAIIVIPWVARNFAVSGTPFGTAGYDFAAGVGHFPGNELDRSLEPDLNRIDLTLVWGKLLSNSARIVEEQLADFGGHWASALFLVGLLIPFRNVTLGRVRWLVVAIIAVLFLAQAMGPPALTAVADGGVANEPLSRNLLGIAGPAAVIFGVGFLFVLLQGLPGLGLRYLVVTVVIALGWIPLLQSLFSRHTGLYYPPAFQERFAGLEATELVMSDVPWATAWYGDRPSVWLTLKHRETDGVEGQNDFYALHRRLPVSALYLSGPVLGAVRTAHVAQWRALADDRAGDDWREFLELAAGLVKRLENTSTAEDAEALRRLLQLADQHWAYGAESSWQDFLLGIYINSEVPTGFPLRRAPYGLWPELFLTDSERKPIE